MMTQNKSKIDWRTIGTAIGAIGALIIAYLQFATAAESANNIRMKALEMRVCRIEAVQGIGECKK